MRETDYVELAFWAGWLESRNVRLSFDDLCEMCESMKELVSDAVDNYLEGLPDVEANA